MGFRYVQLSQGKMLGGEGHTLLFSSKDSPNHPHLPLSPEAEGLRRVNAPGWDEHPPPSPRAVGPPAAPGARASRGNQMELEAIELPVQFTQTNGEPQFTPESTLGSLPARLGQAPHAQHSPGPTGAQRAASAAALLLPSPRQLRHHVF